MNLPGYDAWKLAAPQYLALPACPHCGEPESITDEDRDVCPQCRTPCCETCVVRFRDETGDVLDSACPDCAREM